jgi:serine/threonine protein kinase
MDYEKIKLVDFGVSTRFDKTRATRAAQAGTLRYMPPEQLNGSLSFKTDIWAFGCVLLQFCTGLKPYDDITNEIVATM